MPTSKNYLEWSPLNFITLSLKCSERNYGAVILSKPKTSIKREPSGITFLKGNQPCSLTTEAFLQFLCGMFAGGVQNTLNPEHHHL